MDDERFKEFREDAIQRLAAAMDLPPEIIADNEDYHWSYGYETNNPADEAT